MNGDVRAPEKDTVSMRVQTRATAMFVTQRCEDGKPCDDEGARMGDEQRRTFVCGPPRERAKGSGEVVDLFVDVMNGCWRVHTPSDGGHAR